MYESYIKLKPNDLHMRLLKRKIHPKEIERIKTEVNQLKEAKRTERIRRNKYKDLWLDFLKPLRYEINNAKVYGAIRFLDESPLPSTSAMPTVEIPSSLTASIVALAPVLKVALPVDFRPTRCARHSARSLLESVSICCTRVLTVGDSTRAISSEPSSGVAFVPSVAVAPLSFNSLVNCWAAARAGSAARASDPLLTRPSSVISAETGATTPALGHPRDQPGASSGPLNNESS